MSRTTSMVSLLVGLAFLLSPASLAWGEKKHPAEESGLKSGDSDVETAITFVNKSGKTVKVYWLNQEGDRQLYRTLENGQSYEQHTYLTHPWVITNEDGDAWYVYFADAQPRSIEIVAPKK